MKKFTLLCSALLALAAALPCSAQELPSSASSVVYDFEPWANRGVLQLFANAANEGRQYPTKAEFEAAGIYLDLEFARSHVRPAKILEQSTEKNVVKDVYPTRRLWMNIPSGQGKTTGGYPSSVFHSDVFSMWNYTHIFGSWNHGQQQAPGSWSDAAHKNGTHIYSGLEFFESWGTTSASYIEFITAKNPDGSFKYVDALINACLFFGHDGLNYNIEDSGYRDDNLIAFHRACYKRAKEIGFDSFHIGIYTSNQSLSSSNTPYLLGDTENGKICDPMLNYSSGDFAYRGVSSSLQAAKAAMGTAEDVYQGVWIVGMDRYWTQMNTPDRKEMNLCLWGEHAVSRFFQYTVGTTVMNTQENYQQLLEKGFSGGNRNPIYRPTLANSGNTFQVKGPADANTQLATFGGLASLIPERSAIQGKLPFCTNFSLGNGEIYFYKGKKTHGSWYNMGQQDYVPTYRWLVTEAGSMTSAATNIDVRFTHEDAYIGGSSIRLSGSASSAGTDIVLYRTKLNASAGGVKATVALKNGLEGTNASDLYVIVRTEGSDTWQEYALGDLTGAAWQTKTVDLSGVSQGNNIEYIGLRVKGSNNNYKMLVGQLMISDNRSTVNPAPIVAESVLTEIKEETKSSMSVKLNWSVDDAGYTTNYKERGMVYNDEVAIDHFEVLLRNGVDGKAMEVARTSTWHAYIGNIDLNTYADPYVGVRSVSVDMKTYSPVVWVKLNRYENADELPAAATDVYDPTYINTSSENYEKALETRYFERITTTGADQNLDYTRNSPVGAKDDPANTNYVFEKDHVLKVSQGQTISFFYKGADLSDNIKYCFIKGYIDWDINYDFDGTSDELVFEGGQLNKGTDAIVNPGITVTINVPEDAAVGTSRLRIVASDAWFPHPGPTGGTAKGFSIDFPVEITGSNAQRAKAATYRDARDGGEADQVEGDVSAIDNVIAEQVGDMSVAVNGNMASFVNAEKAWFFTPAGQCVKFVGDATQAVSVENLTAGIYMVRMQNGQFVRTQKVIIK